MPTFSGQAWDGVRARGRWHWQWTVRGITALLLWTGRRASPPCISSGERVHRAAIPRQSGRRGGGSSFCARVANLSGGLESVGVTGRVVVAGRSWWGAGLALRGGGVGRWRGQPVEPVPPQAVHCSRLGRLAASGLRCRRASLRCMYGRPLCASSPAMRESLNTVVLPLQPATLNSICDSWSSGILSPCRHVTLPFDES